jgi:hypothetical protein
VVITAALLLLGAALPSSAAAGSISGTITDAVTEAPIADLEVCASGVPEDGTLFGGCATTDGSGDYAITDLLAHEYRVTAHGDPLGYEYQTYNQALLGYFNDGVAVGSEPVSGIDMELDPYGRIEGAVSEVGTGIPVGGIRVCAWDVTRYYAGSCAYTGADGTYTIPHVRPAEYSIDFLGTGNLLSKSWGHEEQANWWEGAVLPVALSEVVTEIDAQLAPGAQVEGAVRLAGSGQPFRNLFVCALLPGGEIANCARPDLEGHYAIQGLATGEYLIEFKPFSQALQIQYWDHRANVADAPSLSLVAGTTTAGIDGDLVVSEQEQGPAPANTAPTADVNSLAKPAAVAGLSTQPSRGLPEPSSTKPRRCRKGFKRASVHGQVRCVRKPSRRHRR